MSVLLRLYPRAWRERYGEELEDLVAQRPLDLPATFDLVRGALDAHRHPELVDPAVMGAPDPASPVSRQRHADLVVARRLGLASLAGAALWITGWIIAVNGPMVSEAGVEPYRDGAAGWPYAFIATLLLAGGLLGQLIRLASRARAARIAAVVGVVSWPLWGAAPWQLPIGGIALAGVVLLASAAWWNGHWSGRSAAVAVASAAGGAWLIVWPFLGLGVARPAEASVLIAVIALMPIWLTVGITLQTLPPIGAPDAAEGPSPGPLVAA